MTLDINYFKKILEEEKIKVEGQLKRIAKKSLKDDDWQPTPPERNLQQAEEGEAADLIEEMENRLGIEKELEKSLNEINAALLRIEKGTYGICEKTGEPISEERLQANPTARTCRNHL